MRKSATTLLRSRRGRGPPGRSNESTAGVEESPEESLARYQDAITRVDITKQHGGGGGVSPHVLANRMRSAAVEYRERLERGDDVTDDGTGSGATVTPFHREAALRWLSARWPAAAAPSADDVEEWIWDACASEGLTAYQRRIRLIGFNMDVIVAAAAAADPDRQRWLITQASSTELRPDLYVTTWERNKAAAQAAAERDAREDAADTDEGMLVCPHCHTRRARDIESHQMQTRGADEPMTTFAHCLRCGRRWRFC